MGMVVGQHVHTFCTNSMVTVCTGVPVLVYSVYTILVSYGAYSTRTLLILHYLCTVYRRLFCSIYSSFKLHSVYQYGVLYTLSVVLKYTQEHIIPAE